MASEYQRLSLSGSTNYLPVNISSITSASPVLVHTAHAVNADELWLFAYNYSQNDSILSLMLGGNASSQILITPIPAGVGEVPVLMGKTFTGSVVISAFADTVNTVSVLGYINRIIFI